MSRVPLRAQQLMISARHQARDRYDWVSHAHCVSACVVVGATTTKYVHVEANVGSDAMASRCSQRFFWGMEMTSTQTRT